MSCHRTRAFGSSARTEVLRPPVRSPKPPRVFRRSRTFSFGGPIFLRFFSERACFGRLQITRESHRPYSVGVVEDSCCTYMSKFSEIFILSIGVIMHWVLVVASSRRVRFRLCHSRPPFGVEILWFRPILFLHVYRSIRFRHRFCPELGQFFAGIPGADKLTVFVRKRPRCPFTG